MKPTLMLSLVLLVLSATASFARDGSEGGNGGGGVNRKGRYMTFYTAGLYVEPEPKTSVDVPGIDDLVAFINRAPFLSTASKAQLVSTIIPTTDRRYFSVDSTKFSDKVMARLLAEFHRVTQVPVKDLEIFALTDTHSKTTYLLPGYFRLSRNDQMAILFHETYWILNPDATYDKVVAAETAFEAVLDKPTDSLRIIDFMAYYSSDSDQLFFAVKSDLATGALGGFLQAGNKIDVQTLVGDDYISCFNHQLRSNDYSCVPHLKINLYKLSAAYPRSIFLKLIQTNVETLDRALGDMCRLGVMYVKWILFEPVNDTNFESKGQLRTQMMDSVQYGQQVTGRVCGEYEDFIWGK